jgi:hypothetical protein
MTLAGAGFAFRDSTSPPNSKNSWVEIIVTFSNEPLGVIFEPAF